MYLKRVDVPDKFITITMIHARCNGGDGSPRNSWELSPCVSQLMRSPNRCSKFYSASSTTSRAHSDRSHLILNWYFEAALRFKGRIQGALLKTRVSDNHSECSFTNDDLHVRGALFAASRGRLYAQAVPTYRIRRGEDSVCGQKFRTDQ